MSNSVEKKMVSNPSKTTLAIVLCALFAALTAVTSQIAVPIPITPVPINLATFAVFVAGGLLGAKYGTISQIVYVFLGAAGLPVFAGFKSSFATLLGPTGGYIIGYVGAALVVGIICKKGKQKIWVNIVAMVAGLAVLYAFGTAWFMFETKMSLVPALMACVVPFLIGDGLKIILAAIMVNRLKKIVKI